MIYEATISYKNEKWNTEKESYVLNDKESWSDVEATFFLSFNGYKELDVESIKRSKIKEIANSRESEGDLLWMAELTDVFHDDEDNEKTLKYKILFFSKSYESANVFITEYSKQGYDMSLVSLKLAKFADVI